MRLHKSCLVLAILASAFKLGALELSMSAYGTGSTETPRPIYPVIRLGFSQSLEGFSVLSTLELDGSGSYGGLFSGDYGYGGFSVIIREGGIRWKSEYLKLEAGILPLMDEVDAPYSLVLSSLDNTALTTAIRYEDSLFFYDDRWIALNYDSSNTVLVTDAEKPWPDRSAVIKNYGIKLGNMRFGFQDIVVFTDLHYGSSQRGPLFDPAYFFIPAPGFFLQYAYTNLDSPWQKSSALNDNSIMGLFFDWDLGKVGIVAQFLVDDINMNRFFHPSSYQNPDKMAWNCGVRFDTDVGEFRIDQAGATKYTFQPVGSGEYSNEMYGYTFYPNSTYLLDGSQFAINPQSNYVGYLNGENNLAFKVSWKRNFATIDVDSSLELVVTGSQSPVNPWGVYTTWSDGGEGSKLLDETLLEKKLILRGGFMIALGDVHLSAHAALGYIWNRLKLTQVSGEPVNAITNGLPYYSPSGDSSLLASLGLGVKWDLYW